MPVREAEETHRAALFANDKQLLRRVIHLLRVACVTKPAWLETPDCDLIIAGINVDSP